MTKAVKWQRVIIIPNKPNTTSSQSKHTSCKSLRYEWNQVFQSPEEFDFNQYTDAAGLAFPPTSHPHKLATV